MWNSHETLLSFAFGSTEFGRTNFGPFLGDGVIRFDLESEVFEIKNGMCHRDLGTRVSIAGLHLVGGARHPTPLSILSLSRMSLVPEAQSP